MMHLVMVTSTMWPRPCVEEKKAGHASSEVKFALLEWSLLTLIQGASV